MIRNLTLVSLAAILLPGCMKMTIEEMKAALEDLGGDRQVAVPTAVAGAVQVAAASSAAPTAAVGFSPGSGEVLPIWTFQVEDEIRSKPVIEKYIRNVNYRSTERKELGKSKFPSDYKGLVLDPLFEDYISDRYSRMLDAINELKDVRELNFKILQMIDGEINRNQ